MIRALVVAALVGCACGQSPNMAASSRTTCPACPSCPGVPAVDLALCPLDRPARSQVVTELDASPLLRGSGFWCTEFLAGKWAGESDCFRDREPCEVWRRRYGKPNKTSGCRPVERASCVRITNYQQLAIFYRCLLPGQCEAIHARLSSRGPDIVVTECRETE